MPNDMETTTAGRPVDSKFEVTTQSNDDVLDDNGDGNVHGN